MSPAMDGDRGMLGPGLLLAGGVFVADQLTKWLAEAHLASARITLLPGFFDLELVYNRGAAFGLFASLPDGWRQGLLILVALAASGLFVHMLRHSPNRLTAIAVGLVLGGALGNLLDRVRWGWVVDFIHLHWHDLSWPVFNLADSAITVGVAVLLWDNLREHLRH